MNELTFDVKGSSAKPYEVIFIKDGDSLTAICSCMAGQHGNVCKHRIGILDGSTKGIVSDNASEVETVVGWLPGTDVDAELKALRAIEAAKPVDKNELSAAKRKLARAMNT